MIHSLHYLICDKCHNKKCWVLSTTDTIESLIQTAKQGDWYIDENSYYAVCDICNKELDEIINDIS